MARLSGSAPPTSWTVARAAGVSQSTVSRALRGDPRVREETRRRVDAAARRLGYVPNSLAAGLVSRSTRTVAVVVSDLANPFFPALLTPVYDELQLMGYRVVLFTERTDIPTGQETLRRLLDRSIDGVLVTTATLDSRFSAELQQRGLPIVLLNRYIDAMDVDRVVSDNRGGAVIGGRHLIELGHRRIAMIGGPDHVLCCRARLDGHRSALEAAGLSPDDTLIVRTDLTLEDGHTAAVELLGRSPRPTAIFTCNDLQALGVYRAARSLGVRIPADLSVIGFDDLPIAALVHPALTTVRQPLTEMAAAATELALALGRGEKTPQIGLELATSLTVRDSTAPPGRGNS
jgi:LacI family transcriptional regulator